jgi:hypothetical protein
MQVDHKESIARVDIISILLYKGKFSTFIIAHHCSVYLNCNVMVIKLFSLC